MDHAEPPVSFEDVGTRVDKCNAIRRCDGDEADECWIALVKQLFGLNGAWFPLCESLVNEQTEREGRTERELNLKPLKLAIADPACLDGNPIQRTIHLLKYYASASDPDPLDRSPTLPYLQSTLASTLALITEFDRLRITGDEIKDLPLERSLRIQLADTALQALLIADISDYPEARSPNFLADIAHCIMNPPATDSEGVGGKFDLPCVHKEVTWIAPVTQDGDDPYGRGVVNQLTLEWVDDGIGDLYPHPTMVPVIIDEGFHRSLADARQFVQSENAWDSTKDVRWRIQPGKDEELLVLSDRSATLAFVMALLVGSKKLRLQ